MITTKNVNRENLSPMMLQYATIKDQYPNDVVLMRVGDFFEAYFEDALLMSTVGGVRFTAKKLSVKDGEKDSEDDTNKTSNINGEKQPYTVDEIANSKILIPMAGVPHKSLQVYSQKLINSGKRVVVVEQMEDPKTVKGRNVLREVIKIMSTIEKDGEYLTEFLNNYICSIYKEENKYGLCFADVSTSEVFLTTVEGIDGVLNELARYKPSELVLTDEINTLLGNQIENKLKFNIMRTIENGVFELENPTDKVMSCFNIDSIDKIKLGSILELKSLCVTINYIEYTQKLTFNFGKLPVSYDFSNYMNIDMYSRRNLELTESLCDETQRGTLLSVLNTCQTSMGSRLLKQWLEKPLLSKNKITSRLEGVSELVLEPKLLEEIQKNLFGVLDISRIMGRLSRNSSIPRDLINLRDSLRKMPIIFNYLSKFDSSILKDLYKEMGTFEDLVYLLDTALLEDPAGDIKEGIVLKPGYNADLDTARDMIENSNKYFAELEERERVKTGIKNLKVVNKNSKCTFEVRKINYDKVPDYFKIEKALKDSTRYVTDESEALEKDLFSAIERSKSIEIDLYEELKSVVLGEYHNLTILAEIIATFDVLCSLSKVAISYNYVCPKLNNEGYINIKGGRHPVVEKLSSEKFVSNDTLMDMSSNNFILLTGPNMAGKSTYMRQVALITVMAHIGSFVPGEYADIPLTDKIFTRIGASDDISSGRSTYMVEMVEVKNIIDNATKKSLVLLDEVGRGTSTSDGLSIAQALTEHIYNNIGCKTLFATHYHELIALENSLQGLKNYHMSVSKENNDLVFIRKLKQGGLSESYGIDVAKLAGIPDSVINRAWEVLGHIEGKKEYLKDDGVMSNIMDSNKAIEMLKYIDKATLTPISAYKMLLDILDVM